MDILNDDDDTSMEDSTNNNNNDMDSSLNDNNDDSDNNNEDEEGVIDHERLVALSNYADQNQDNPSWYWNVGTVTQCPPAGWSVYRPLSSLTGLEREEIRQGETTRMVTHWYPERYEDTGIRLDWGEYYVADDEMSSNSNEESSLSSYEEAEEIDEEELEKEDKQAASHAINNDTSHEQFAMNYDQLDTNIDVSNPTLMGMPDIVLEKILHYSTEQPSAVCVLERVCKRIRRLTTGDDFWSRHPFWPGYRWESYDPFGSSPRKAAFMLEGLRNIRKYQKGGRPYIILNALRGEEGGCVAGTFRTLSANILSRMNHIGPVAHFRLRGDTIGYISELLQGYMIERLQMAMYLVIHKLGYSPYDMTAVGNSTRCTVQMEDIQLAFQKDMSRPFFCGVTQRPPRCNVASRVHGKGSALDCSCSLPSVSGIIWKWPGDNCHDILPPEAGRRIIRILAYQAGILRMSMKHSSLRRQSYFMPLEYYLSVHMNPLWKWQRRHNSFLERSMNLPTTSQLPQLICSRSLLLLSKHHQFTQSFLDRSKPWQKKGISHQVMFMGMFG